MLGILTECSKARGVVKARVVPRRVRPMPLWPTLAHAIDGRPTSPADHEAEAWGR